MQKPKVLVIDDDELWLDQVPQILKGDYEIDAYATIDQGLMAIEAHFYDVVLLDLNFEGDSRSGLEVFRKIHAIDRETDVIIISGETDYKKLIEIFNAGVCKFIPKMSELSTIRSAVEETLRERETRQRAYMYVTDASRIPLIGNSPVMQLLRRNIARVIEAGTKDILLTGETGTGKELVAQAIAAQANCPGRLVVVHCGAINENLVETEFFGHVKGAFTGADRDKVGAFEAAGGGFVFLDEIGELPLSQQPKLLRVLQERKVQPVGTYQEKSAKFRCISATHVNLDEAVKAGKFRQDLYYRLAKEVINIPALRERTEDIPELVHYFLKSNPLTKSKRMTSEAMAILQSYQWPGNIRQLRAVVESIATKVSDQTIRECDIYQILPEATSLRSTVTTRKLIGSYGASIIMNERERYEKAIIKSQGSRDAAAKLLGISRATFFRRAKEFGLVRSREGTC